MFKLYDTAFKIGFIFNILIFLILNIVSFNIELAKDKQLKADGISFSPPTQFSWGFPFDMTHYEFFSLNLLIISSCGFLVGLIFRFGWSKLNPKTP